jgi:hypothetical protein
MMDDYLADAIRAERTARLKMRILLALVALWICSGSVFAVSQTSSFQFSEEPGPYPVGLKVRSVRSLAHLPLFTEELVKALRGR